MIRRIDGDQMQQAAKEADFLVMEFSRREVTSGLIGDALDRLLTLSDSPEHVRRFANGLTFVFQGFDQDPREIYEIPECRAYIQQLTRQWPYWFHFLERAGPSFSSLLCMLCEVKVSGRSKSNIATSFMNAEEVGCVVMRLFDGMNLLYEQHEFTDAENIAMTEQVNVALDHAFG